MPVASSSGVDCWAISSASPSASAGRETGEPTGGRTTTISPSMRATACPGLCGRRSLSAYMASGSRPLVRRLVSHSSMSDLRTTATGVREESPARLPIAKCRSSMSSASCSSRAKGTTCCSLAPAFIGTSGSANSTSAPGTRTHTRRPADCGAASDRGPLWGEPVGAPCELTISHVAAWSGERGNRNKSQSAIRSTSVRRHAADDRVHCATAPGATAVLKQKTVQVEFSSANSDQAAQAEVTGTGGELDYFGHFFEGSRIEGPLIIAQRREAPGCVGPILVQGRRLEVLMAQKGIQNDGRSRTGIQPGGGGQSRDVGGQLVIVLAPEVRQGKDLRRARNIHIRGQIGRILAEIGAVLRTF